MMKIIITRNYKELSRKAAEIVREVIKERLKKRKNTSSVSLLLPTGRTPIGMYKELIKYYKDKNKNKKLDFSRVKFFNLDEYLGAKPDDKDSYNYYLRKRFLNKINALEKNIFILRGDVNPREQIKEYEKLLSKGVDLAILGVGVDSHIAFDEPGTSFNSKTHITKLKRSTIKRNKTRFKEAITVGIKTIMKSKKILLLASGKDKARAIRALLFHKISEKEPVTILRKHKDLTVIITEDIAREI